jgi:hypothetical protein
MSGATHMRKSTSSAIALASLPLATARLCKLNTKLDHTRLSSKPTLAAFNDHDGRTMTISRDVAKTALCEANAVPIQGSRTTVGNRCDHCRGRFGMVTHRWWGKKFCNRTCKGAYLSELALSRERIRSWVRSLCGNIAFITWCHRSSNIRAVSRTMLLPLNR